MLRSYANISNISLAFVVHDGRRIYQLQQVRHDGILEYSHHRLHLLSRGLCGVFRTVRRHFKCAPVHFLVALVVVVVLVVASVYFLVAVFVVVLLVVAPVHFLDAVVAVSLLLVASVHFLVAVVVLFVVAPVHFLVAVVVLLFFFPLFFSSS